MQGLPRPSTTYRTVAVLRTILPESPESGVCASAGVRRQGRAGPTSATASSGRTMRAIVASDFIDGVAWAPTSIRPRALQSQFRWLTSEHQENAARPVGAARLFLAAKWERPFSHFLSYPPMRFTANVYRRPPDARTGSRRTRAIPGSNVAETYLVRTPPALDRRIYSAYT